MPRIRTVKPEFFTSSTLAQLPLQTERTFIGLWTQADDKGRFKDNPIALNSALWSGRPRHTVQQMIHDLHILVETGQLCRYVTANGDRYLHIPTWDQHQRITASNRRTAPPCPIHDKPRTSATPAAKPAGRTGQTTQPTRGHKDQPADVDVFAPVTKRKNAVNPIIGLRAARLRTELGLKSSVIARTINVPAAKFSKFEHGKRNLSDTELTALAEALNVTYAALTADYD